MQLASIRIITANVDHLVAFYETVTGLTAMRHTPDFAEIRTSGATLAIGSTRTLALFSGDAVAEAAANRSAIIEFHVGDVDAEHARIASSIDVTVVQPPTTMPWGNRSLLLRDELCWNLGDGSLRKAAYRGGCPSLPEPLRRERYAYGTVYQRCPPSSAR